MFENVSIPENLRPSDPRFGAGPSLVPVEFLQKLAETGPHYMGTSHRKPAVKNVVKEMQDGIRTFFKVPDDYTIAIGNGGATFLFDMIGLGVVKKKSVHYTCGEFSKKWFKSHNKIPWIEAEEIQVDMGQGITPKVGGDADFIACTLNETSTGVMIDELPEVGPDQILAVDATSGGGQCPCDVSKVDMFFFSPQKVFASDGGFFVCIMSPKARKRAEELAADSSRYIPEIMNWKLCLDNSDKNQTYNTPALATIFFLNEQVKKMNEFGGYDKVIETARQKAEIVYGWAESKDYLSPFIQDTKYRSISVCTIDVDDKYDVNALLKTLMDQKIVYNIDAYRKLGRNQFRIGIFHNVTVEDTRKLTELLSHAIENA